MGIWSKLCILLSALFGGDQTWGWDFLNSFFILEVSLPRASYVVYLLHIVYLVVLFSLFSSLQINSLYREVFFLYNFIHGWDIP